MINDPQLSETEREALESTIRTHEPELIVYTAYRVFCKGCGWLSRIDDQDVVTDEFMAHSREHEILALANTIEDDD